MEKIYTVNQAIWIAAAAYAYVRYKKQEKTKLTDVFLSAPQLQKLAAEYTDGEVQAARIHHHCNGDHANPSHRFLRKLDRGFGNANFRVTAKGEFGGDREWPDDLDWDNTIVFEGTEIRLRELRDFLKDGYANFIGASSREEIDFVGVLEYLEHNRGLPYSNPEAAGVDPDEKNRLLAIKARGQAVIAEMKKMAALCKDRFGLDRCEPMSWLDGSNTKTRGYLWAQMKYSKYADNPISISIFVEISPLFGKARFRYSLEIRENGLEESWMRRYHSFLDLPIEGTGLAYMAGSNEFGEPEPLDLSAEEIRKGMAEGRYLNAHLCRNVEPLEGMDNEQYEREMLETVGALIPFYEYVVGCEGQPSDFFPKPEDYDPGIAAEEYERILGDESIVKRQWMDMLRFLYQMGGVGTCKQIANRYGNGAAHYNTNAINIAKAVAKETGCPLDVGDNGEKRYWPVLFYGKGMPEGSGEGIFCYKMREPVMAAVKALEEGGVFQDMDGRECAGFGKNIILYGPPGTGKTYHSVIYAVAICDGKAVDELTDYDVVLKRYNELKAEGRIAFTTFHQSYGYEEFIEGIKPVIGEGKTSGEVSYRIEPGVFKRFCEWTCFDQAWGKLIGDARKNGNKYTFVRRTGTALEMALINDALFRISFQGELKNHIDISKDKVKNLFETADYEERENYPNNGTRWVFDACYAIVDALTSKYGLKKSAGTGNRVFIIDEINRGNISKIFGELITLIEDAKRRGMPEAASAILPYSGEEFSVPDNVYILGTMNTADRSIALLDTALRRRFQFIEKMPDSDVLKGIMVEGLDISAMLAVINKRIEFLYDREHTIGHAFFIGLKEEPTLQKLASVFSRSVIPLLQEYFYEDYQKIQLVLGDNGKKPEESHLKFIKEEKLVSKELFAGSVEDIADLPEKSFQINPEALGHIESYKRIGPGL